MSESETPRDRNREPEPAGFAKLREEDPELGELLDKIDRIPLKEPTSDPDETAEVIVASGNGVLASKGRNAARARVEAKRPRQGASTLVDQEKVDVRADKVDGEVAFKRLPTTSPEAPTLVDGIPIVRPRRRWLGVLALCVVAIAVAFLVLRMPTETTTSSSATTTQLPTQVATELTTAVPMPRPTTPPQIPDPTAEKSAVPEPTPKSVPSPTVRPSAKPHTPPQPPPVPDTSSGRPKVGPLHEQ